MHNSSIWPGLFRSAWVLMLISPQSHMPLVQPIATISINPGAKSNNTGPGCLVMAWWWFWRGNTYWWYINPPSPSSPPHVQHRRHPIASRPQRLPVSYGFRCVSNRGLHAHGFQQVLYEEIDGSPAVSADVPVVVYPAFCPCCC